MKPDDFDRKFSQARAQRSLTGHPAALATYERDFKSDWFASPETVPPAQAPAVGCRVPFPQTEAGLVAAGYQLERRGVACHGQTCSALVDWWRTPRGKRIPLDHLPGGQGVCRPHWASCPDAGDFKVKGRR